MKQIWFIRHGESQANAGQATLNNESITLTDTGHEQARRLAAEITQRPGLIIVTPYIRTQQTAAPTIAKFPGVPVETWPLHEFDYLSPGQCAGTTAAERRAWVEEYWQRCDPDLVHGPGAESFNHFQQRILPQLTQLQQHPAQLLLVFTHGYVIRLLMQHFEQPNFPSGTLRLQHFVRQQLALNIKNTHIYKVKLKR